MTKLRIASIYIHSRNINVLSCNCVLFLHVSVALMELLKLSVNFVLMP